MTLQVGPVIIIQLEAITNANARKLSRAVRNSFSLGRTPALFQDRFNEPDSPLKRNYFDELTVDFRSDENINRPTFGRMIVSQIYLFKPRTFIYM